MAKTVTGKDAYTHVAMYQARITAANILGRPHEPANYRALPRVTSTNPEVGAVDLTEAQAPRQRGVGAHRDSGELPSAHFGRSSRIPASAMEAYLNPRTAHTESEEEP
ncbi:hypothetical protein [Arthrobacter sp. H14]|uniref:hypothetical protein n=1 Tax=Arthrobacter sp. H14 TaxID=1312959 RepID=UPI000479E243|nr:hypothetical protein [Arthrobacter sp. H14]